MRKTKYRKNPENLKSTGSSQKTVESVLNKESMVGMICEKDVLIALYI